MIGIPVGLSVANAAEWWIHKNVLHGQGRDRKSFWSFHWYEHHTHALKEDMYDSDYRRFPLGNHAQGKEILGLVARREAQKQAGQAGAGQGGQAA